MASKGVFTLVAFVSLVISVGATSCKESRPEGLRFVGNGRSGQRQSERGGLVVVVHGWVDRGWGGWPEDMAVAIRKRVEPNSWLCGYFDWSEGAKTFNPTDAAEYARDMAGPRLAQEIIKSGGNWRHIHLIGHSSGCWAVSEAAKILARKTKADIHLTFLDAYVPALWEGSLLGDVETAADVNCWAEHYYTRDLTFGWTQQDLSNAHNVDVTNIDGVLKNHKFPWQWYYTTIGGKYPKGNTFDDRGPVQITDGIAYGFARSREAADSDSWNRSLKLPVGNKAVKLKKREQ
jgi:hypothetical protein